MKKLKNDKNLDRLFTAILSLENLEEARAFFRDLCTLEELKELSERWQIANLLDQNMPYRKIAEKLQVSTTTVSRVASWLNGGMGGYRLALDKISHHHSSESSRKS